MDLRLITILPAQTTQGVQQPSGTAGNTSSGLTSLSGIPSGTVLSGFIINRDASGNPVLRTEGGDITFASSIFLKIGVEVQIRVEQTVNNTIARLLTVDGQPPEAAEARSSFSASPDVILSQALASRSSLSNLASQVDARAPANTQATANSSSIATNNSDSPAITVKGTVITPNQPQTAGLPAKLPEGSELLLKLVTVLPPGGQSAQGSVNIAPPTNLASYAAYARATGSFPTAQTQAAITAPVPPAAQVTTTAGNTTVISPTAVEPLQAPLVTSATAVAQAKADISVAQPAANAAQPNNNVQVTTTTATGIPSPLTAGDDVVATAATPAIPTGAPAAAATGNTAAVAYTPAATTGITLQPGQTITGMVIGNEPTGEALVQTNLGLIRLQPGSTLPVGSSISFELVNSAIPQTHLNMLAAIDEPAPLAELAKNWSSLAQIFALLSGRDSASSIDFVQPNMPWLMMDGSPSPQSLISPQNMPSGLLMFLAALKGEDFKTWLGRHNSQWLEENGHGALLKKAGAEFASMARQFNETANQTWQTMMFPVAVEGELQQVRLYVKRDKKKEGNRQQGDSEDTRFVVEVDTTQLGEIQMDGFVRRGGEQRVHFDLMVRSKQPLPPEVQQDILAIYQSTGELTGYQGNLQFQSVTEFPVHPAEEQAPHPHNDLMA